MKVTEWQRLSSLWVFYWRWGYFDSLVMWGDPRGVMAKLNQGLKGGVASGFLESKRMLNRRARPRLCFATSEIDILTSPPSSLPPHHWKIAANGLEIISSWAPETFTMIFHSQWLILQDISSSNYVQFCGSLMIYLFTNFSFLSSGVIICNLHLPAKPVVMKFTTFMFPYHVQKVK